MTTITLGYQPAGLIVHLTRYADFVQTLSTADSTDWPAGTAISIVFADGTTWAATISGPTAAWHVDETDIEALYTALAGPSPRVKVTYTDGAGTDLTWMTGWVQWHG